MTQSSAAKAAFAPAWPYLYKTPTGRQIIPPYGQISVFNRDLTIDELKPLTEAFTARGRLLRLIGAYTFLVSYLFANVLWFVGKTKEESHSLSADTAQQLHAAVEFFGPLVLSGAVLCIAGIAIDVVTWAKWSRSLTTAWVRYEGRIVRTKDLPEVRRQSVNGMGDRLDTALEQLDANDPAARRLDTAARAAIGHYLDLPVISNDMDRIARSNVSDASVQAIRDQYRAAVAAENIALQEAGDAVKAVQDYAAEVKAAAAEREIIELAKTIAGGSQGTPRRV